MIKKHEILHMIMMYLKNFRDKKKQELQQSQDKLQYKIE
jgi:hypothetical protein